MSFLIRASYPNYYMIRLYAKEGREIFNKDNDDVTNTLEGNKPGTVIYTDNNGHVKEFPPRWYDMFYLLKLHDKEREDYFNLLLNEKEHHEELNKSRDAFWKNCQEYAQANPLWESNELITTLTKGDFTDEEISHKGRILLDLTRNCYPVPDFCIITSAAFNHPEHMPELIEHAIDNLEIMTGNKLGDSRHPLVFAIRCAMPQYIPGLMPTLLNIGMTREAYEGFRLNHAEAMANRVYLSTLHSICQMLKIEHRYEKSDIELSNEMQTARIEEMEQKIIATGTEGERTLHDAHYQAIRLILHVRDFYIENQDLILTFMQGKQAFPSFILQKMVWTIGNNESYPGVLYSHHSRTGSGCQIESYRNIFGEEIMTGDVTSEDRCYHNRNEIKDIFPAVYHFHPLLKKLEMRHHSPVTIEFAVETLHHKVSLFSVLQLNMSEMTGRAALLSAINMYQEGMIDEPEVMDLIKPYHLRQIISASIDDSSLEKLQYFGKGLSVLPRTAITATLCFSAMKAHELKSMGMNVCLCQDRFIPEDTITLNEVDAIMSMTPAAIHVVTACRGYGIPAFMDLQSFGIRKVGDKLINEDGLELKEMDMITVSSKRQTIYKGVADFKPARFTKYLNNEPVELNDEEKVFFEDMKVAYAQYQEIVNSTKANYIADVDTLARLIRCDLQNKPKQARIIVNNWYQDHSELYIKQVLESKMGDHQDQSRVFNLLYNNNKIGFFKQASEACIIRGISGLKAGSFMLGRFVAKPLPTSVWNSLSDMVTAFLLNEYVLYEKYLHVLEEVGEIRLARAHSRIETTGIDNMVIKNFDLYNFVPLLYADHDWNHIKSELESIEHQENTHMLVEKLALPIEELFDMTKPWIKAQVEAKRVVE